LINDRYFDRFDHLAFNSPYFLKQSNKILQVSPTFRSAISLMDSKPSIDVAAITQILNVGYCFADRTLVREVNRAPWMAKPNEDYSDWDYASIPAHGFKEATPTKIAEDLFGLLCDELRVYCDNKVRIGILLSGGMDSRIVAIAIKYLQDIGDVCIDVVGLTWGVEESRDVVYAKRVVKAMGWDWQHFQLSPDNLLENIEVAAERGAEYSPVHLHAMPQVSKVSGLEAVIAGSYGDSIGRAEFSGSHVSRISSIDNHFFNRFKLLYQTKFQSCISEKNGDLSAYATLFPRKEIWQGFEVQRQSHYMRRMLNPCMEVINNEIPLYQAFTSPKVFGHMWLYKPALRNDEIYFHILSKFGKSVKDIPWARTGVSYFNQSGDEKPDHYTSLNNQYGHWIRKDLYAQISELVMSSEIEKLNVFNMDTLKMLLKVNKLSKKASITKLDENLIWLASLARFVKKYSVEGTEEYRPKMGDYVDAYFSSIFYATAYNGKSMLHNWLKK